jgi:hypothetical protein
VIELRSVDKPSDAFEAAEVALAAQSATRAGRGTTTSEDSPSFKLLVAKGRAEGPAEPVPAFESVIGASRPHVT